MLIDYPITQLDEIAIRDADRIGLWDQSSGRGICLLGQFSLAPLVAHNAPPVMSKSLDVRVDGLTPEDVWPIFDEVIRAKEIDDQEYVAELRRDIKEQLDKLSEVVG